MSLSNDWSVRPVPTLLGTLLGTLVSSFPPFVRKTEGKQAKATVSYTAASVRTLGASGVVVAFLSKRRGHLIQGLKRSRGRLELGNY